MAIIVVIAVVVGYMLSYHSCLYCTGSIYVLVPIDPLWYSIKGCH